MIMPAGRLLRLVRPVGRHHATYTRVGKAVRPLSRRKEAKGPVGSAAKSQESKDTRDTSRISDARDSKEPSPEDGALATTPNTPDSSRTTQNEHSEANEQKDERSPESNRSGPMDAVLYMRGPAIEPPTASRTHPPMPFTHYFDTYEMVNRLTDAKFQRGQAITTMKAVRALLGGKMQEAQKRLVSKGDVDNVCLLSLLGLSRCPVVILLVRRSCGHLKLISFSPHISHLTSTETSVSLPHYSLSYPVWSHTHTRTKIQIRNKERKNKKENGPQARKKTNFIPSPSQKQKTREGNHKSIPQA